MLGAMTGNHACLYRGETRLLIVTGGIEDGFAALDLANNEALFVQQYLDYIGMHSAYPWFIFNQCSVWAALSAGGMANLELPPRGKLEFTDILIIADPDDAGRKAAQQLGERSSKMGYFAEIWYMQEKYGDLNNLLKFWKANDAFKKWRGAI